MRGKLLGAAAAGIFALGMSSSAHATFLSFSIVGLGDGFTVDTGDITAATTLKTIPSLEIVGGVAGGSDPGAAAAAGVASMGIVTFSTLSLPTVNGPFLFTMDVGNLTITFTSISQVHITPTGSLVAGLISQQFNGTVTGDSSMGQLFLGQTASLSETCTQTSLQASISCTESFSTPGLPIDVPEPATLTLVGLSAAGLGLIRRRRKD